MPRESYLGESLTYTQPERPALAHASWTLIVPILESDHGTQSTLHDAGAS